MRNKVVVSQSGVTAGQLKDLFRMIDDGTVGFHNLAGFLVNPHQFTKGQGSVVRALKILGERRVFTPEKVAEAWNPLRNRAGLAPLVLPQGVPVPSEDILLEATKKGGDWVLAYSYGLSLREQRQVVGANTNQQPCFYGNDWWLKQKEDNWATKGGQPGYYLVDLKGRFGCQTWQAQEESIRAMGQGYERADEHLIGEIALTAYLINGERPLENFYHWGKSLDSVGGRVYVGGFDRGGLSGGGYCPPDWGDGSSLRVCVLRKFQN